MATQVRSARASWSGDLNTGTGSVSTTTTGAFKDLPVSWGSRTAAAEGRTSPEELLAAAHAACFSMALSARIAKAGGADSRTEVEARVTFDQVPSGGWGIVSSELHVKAKVKGIDAAKLREVAEDAKENCPVSRALKGNVRLSVEAELA